MLIAIEKEKKELFRHSKPDLYRHTMQNNSYVLEESYSRCSSFAGSEAALNRSGGSEAGLVERIESRNVVIRWRRSRMP